MAIVIVWCHRHGLLVDAADRSGYGNVVAIAEGDVVADLNDGLRYVTLSLRHKSGEHPEFGQDDRRNAA